MEAPETAGTALKTVLARFGEVKTLISQGETTGTTDEGEEVDVNKIDTALKSVGVRLTDTTGQMRNLDDVILELAEKWDSLDTMTQRYIATQAAGSRQQSRFLALMGDSERLTELLGLAMNSAGASEEQFAKTQDSLESKLNNLKTAWTEFTTGITNSDLIKWAVSAATDILNLINSITEAIGLLDGSLLKLGLLIGSLRIVNKAILGMGPSILKFLNLAKSGAGSGAAEATARGSEDGQAYATSFWAKVKAFFSAEQGAEAATQQATESVQGAQAGTAFANSYHTTVEAIDDFYYAYGDEEQLARAMQTGTITGTAQSGTKNSILMTGDRTYSVWAIKQAYQTGKAAGTSAASGVISGITTVLTTTVLGPILLAAIAGAIGWVIGKAIENQQPVNQAKKAIEELDAEIEENTNKISEYQEEIDLLDQKKELGEITKVEQNRLKWLEQQTEELEKQNELKKQEEIEQRAILRANDSTFSVQTGYKESHGGDVLTPIIEEMSWDEAIKYYQERMQWALDTEQNTAYKEYEAQLNALYKQMKTDLVANWDVDAGYLTDEEFEEYILRYKELGDATQALSNQLPEAYEKLSELSEAGELNGTTVENLIQTYPQLQIYLDTVGISAGSLAAQFNKVTKAEKEASDASDWKATATQLKTVKSTLSKIGDILSDFEENGFADVSGLADLYDEESLSEITDALDNYFQAMTNASSYEEAKQATDDLVTAYLNQASTLDDLAAGNDKVYIATLKRMGVENAEELVAQKLTNARAEQYVQTLDLVEVTNKLSDETVDNTQYLQDLAKQCDSTADAVAYYALQKQIANMTQLSTEAERKQLQLLIGALGEGGKAYQAYANIMTVVATQQAKLTKIQNLMVSSPVRAQAEALHQGYEDVDKYIEALTNNIDANLTAANEKLEKANEDYQKNFIGKVSYNSPSSTDSSSSDLSSFNSSISQLQRYELALEGVEDELERLQAAEEGLTDYQDILENKAKQAQLYQEKLSILKQTLSQIDVLLAESLAEGQQFSSTWYELTEDGVAVTAAYYAYIASLGDEITDSVKETLEAFEDWVDEYNDLIKSQRTYQKSIEELTDELEEQWEDYRDAYIDIVNELADIYEEEAQDEIDALKDKYDKMKEEDDDYLDSLRKNIEARRDARDRENDVEEIADKQKRLQMLMRDTSGRNAGEIASLQKEIEEAQQDLIDDDVDRMLDAMEEANDQEQENWDREIEALEDQLEQDKKNGKFIQAAEELLEDNPQAVKDKFEEYYSTQGTYSQAEINSKLDDLEVQLGNAISYLQNQDKSSYVDSQISDYGEEDESESGGTHPASKEILYYNSDTQQMETGYMGTDENNKDTYWHTFADADLTEDIPIGSYVVADNGNQLWKKTGTDQNQRIYPLGENTPDVSTVPADILEMLRKYAGLKFKNGGLVNFTGPAWVDGTNSRPEAFLNAEDTQNFTELKSILAQLMRADRISTFQSNTTGRTGDCNIYVNIDEIASDYDVSDAIDRIKEEMISSSQYRNINLINRRR